MSYWPLGLALLILGASGVAGLWWITGSTGQPRLTGALAGGFLAAAATGVGTLPVLFMRRMSSRTSAGMLGFGAGVMFAASVFSLILPGLAAAEAQGAGPWGAALTVALGVLVGAALLMALGRWLPTERWLSPPGQACGRSPSEAESLALHRTWMFVLAVALHNLPEGLAIGVAFAGPELDNARALSMGIAIQDIPEGLVIAVALRSVGYRRRTAVLLGCLSGLVEPLGAVLAVTLVGASAALLPWGLAFAAGAMLLVVSQDMIPESHRKGHALTASVSLMTGFVLMMVLDTALG